jgi:two-component system response regulator AtoC
LIAACPDIGESNFSGWAVSTMSTNCLRSQAHQLKRVRGAIMRSTQTAVVLDKESAQRDRIRGRLNDCGVLPICFQDEWICLENIPCIRPSFAVLRTDSYPFALRFVNLAKAIDGDFPIFVLSDKADIESYIRDNWMVNLYFLRYPAEIQAFRETLNLIPASRCGSNGPILIAGSSQRKRLLQRLPLLALSREPVLIHGGPGVGKKSIARAIHRWSVSRNAVPRFIGAGDVTPTWIHEMGERIASGPNNDKGPPISIIENIEKLEPQQQSQLLSLLDHVDDDGTGTMSHVARSPFITLAGVNIERLTRQGAFRKDLYHRLSVFKVNVPPLKGHVDDIVALADFFAVYFGIRSNRGICRLPEVVLDRFAGFHWPENVKELKAAVRRLVETDRTHWPKTLDSIFQRNRGESRTVPIVDKMEIRDYLKCHDNVSLKKMKSRYAGRVEKELMKVALKQTNGNCKRAAVLLNISYKSMLNKAKAYRLV